MHARLKRSLCRNHFVVVHAFKEGDKIQEHDECHEEVKKVVTKRFCFTLDDEGKSHFSFEGFDESELSVLYPLSRVFLEINRPWDDGNDHSSDDDDDDHDDDDDDDDNEIEVVSQRFYFTRYDNGKTDFEFEGFGEFEHAKILPFAMGLLIILAIVFLIVQRPHVTATYDHDDEMAERISEKLAKVETTLTLERLEHADQLLKLLPLVNELFISSLVEARKTVETCTSYHYNL
ncbi:hypothetical protein QVD17_17692 [Tagetes erecta]|uniref:Uncharacterized protein n=1 Tax=Tagetes erecta TaxID=13708 RepID=A0AAD8P1P7_TARER|nr:hypothetical protein QVD17_17692 [Tagetes erecta]